MEDFLVGLFIGVVVTVLGFFGIAAIAAGGDREVCMQLTGAERCEFRMVPVDLTTPERKAK